MTEGKPLGGAACIFYIEGEPLEEMRETPYVSLPTYSSPHLSEIFFLPAGKKISSVTTLLPVFSIRSTKYNFHATTQRRDVNIGNNKHFYRDEQDGQDET